MAKIKTELSKEEIESKKSLFLEKINESIELSKNGRISPSKKFLNEIKDLVKQAIENGVTYRQLTKDIYATFNFKIAEQTLRIYVKSLDGIKVQNIDDTKSKKQATTVKEMKQELKQKNNDEYSL